MSRFFTLLVGALALTSALAVEFSGDDDELDFAPVPNVTVPTTTQTPLPAALDDAGLSLIHAPVWTFEQGQFGPDNWGIKYPKCSQLLQAPINIDTSRVILSKLQPLKFKNFEQNFTITVGNLFRFGHLDFMQIKPRISVTGGPLPGKTRYYLVGAFLMVGRNNSHGSAHSINGKKGAFEISFVFHPNVSTTADSIQYGPEMVIYFQGKIAKNDNPNYASVVNSLKKVTKGGSKARCQLKSLRSLFPRKAWEQTYFTYTANALIPPCTEGRIRVNYMTPIRISRKQLQVFRSLRNEHSQPITHNFRPTQNSTYVQVFSSVDKLPMPRPTTRRPKPNVIEDPYQPAPIPTTTTTTTVKPVPNIVEDPYHPAPVPTKPRTTTTTTTTVKPLPNIVEDPYHPTPRPNIITTSTTEELFY